MNWDEDIKRYREGLEEIKEDEIWNKMKEKIVMSMHWKTIKDTKIKNNEISFYQECRENRQK